MNALQGLVCKDLAKLKRATHSHTGQGSARRSKPPSVPAPEPMIARLSGGTSFDFNSKGDPTLYLVATDDGRIHQVGHTCKPLHVVWQ